MRQMFGSDVDGVYVSLQAARWLLRQGQRHKLFGGIATRLKDATFTEVATPCNVGSPRRGLRICGHLYLRGTGCYMTPWQTAKFESIVHGRLVNGPSDDVLEWQAGSDIDISVKHKEEELRSYFVISRRGCLSVAHRGAPAVVLALPAPA